MSGDSTSSLALWLPAAGALLGLACLWRALRSGRKRRLVDGLPTSKTTGVFIGLVEVKGTAESSQPLTSRLAGKPCVQFAWTVEEKWSRLVTETVTDSKGRTSTRVRTESGWTTVASGGAHTPFYLRDDCGLLLIRPEGAQIEAPVVFEQSCGRNVPLYYAHGPAAAVAHSDHVRRFREVALGLHTPIYVVGQARERADVIAAEIAADPEAPLFLISHRAEKQIRGGFALSFWVLLCLGLVVCCAGAGLGLASKFPTEGQAWIPFALGGAGYGVMVLVGWVWSVFNSFVDLRHRVNRAWSQVDVQLKRRADILPRLEAVLKGLTAHERAVQESITALRAEQAATPPGVAGPDFHALGGRLLVLAEAYPELKTHAAFLALQHELVESEQRIALARGYFNEIATHYNTQREIIPDRFVAALGGFRERPLFAANDFERAPVQAADAA
jgi:hypothetical protein